MSTIRRRRLKSPLAKSSHSQTFPAEDFASVSQIILQPNDACPYKEICSYNKTPERCYGSFERKNEFICDLEKLRLMYRKLNEDSGQR